jgi:hypothetical protein
MNLKHINIVDPCFSKNNLGKSISLFNSHRLKEAFSMQDDLFCKIINKAKKKHKSGRDAVSLLIKEHCKIFKYTLECTGMLPPVNLKMPQMILKPQKKSSSSERSQNGANMKNKEKGKTRSELKTKLFED